MGPIEATQVTSLHPRVCERPLRTNVGGDVFYPRPEPLTGLLGDAAPPGRYEVTWQVIQEPFLVSQGLAPPVLRA